MPLHRSSSIYIVVDLANKNIASQTAGETPCLPLRAAVQNDYLLMAKPRSCSHQHIVSNPLPTTGLQHLGLVADVIALFSCKLLQVLRQHRSLSSQGFKMLKVERKGFANTQNGNRRKIAARFPIQQFVNAIQRNGLGEVL